MISRAVRRCSPASTCRPRRSGRRCRVRPHSGTAPRAVDAQRQRRKEDHMHMHTPHALGHATCDMPHAINADLTLI
eukprot:1785419-Prymnesium_polylepis.1